MNTNQSRQEGEKQILSVLSYFLRYCFQADILSNHTHKHELLQMIDMSVKSLFQIECDPEIIYSHIFTIGMKSLRNDFSKVEWYLNRILPGYVQYYEKIYLTDDESTIHQSDIE
jgi:hypothetical protein